MNILVDIPGLTHGEFKPWDLHPSHMLATGDFLGLPVTIYWADQWREFQVYTNLPNAASQICIGVYVTAGRMIRQSSRVTLAYWLGLK